MRRRNWEVEGEKAMAGWVGERWRGREDGRVRAETRDEVEVAGVTVAVAGTAGMMR